MKDLGLLYELVLSMKEHQEELMKKTVAIQQDLKYHIKRTDLLETRTEYVMTWKQLLLVVTVTGSIIGILKTLGVF